MAKKTEQVPPNVNDVLMRELQEKKLTNLVKLADEFCDMQVVCVPTGLAQLDYILHPMKRGFPLGRDVEIYSKDPECGKAQPLTASVKTLEGWKLMGDLEIGEPLASIDGEPSIVEAVYPQGFRRVWKVTFSDGRFTRCCGEHLWDVTKNHPWWRRNHLGYQIMNTYELREALGSKSNKKQFSIPTVSGDFGCAEELPLDPELLGHILGDGGISDDRTPGYTTADPENVKRVNDLLVRYNCTLHKQEGSKYDYNIVFEGKRAPGCNPVRSALNSLGLLGHRSEDKFIPYAYLLASKTARQALLRGLLDTDGNVAVKGSVQANTSSLQLARDTQKLVWSLGGIGTISPVRITKYTYKGEKRDGLPSYRVSVIMKNIGDVVGLGRKRTRLNLSKENTPRLSIVSIEPDGVEEMRCIKVSHPSHLYVTDDYIVTHNTSLGMTLLASAQKQGLRVAVADIEKTITDELFQIHGIVTDPFYDPNIYALRLMRHEDETIPAEEVLEGVKTLSQLFDVIVIDSVAALESKANLEKSVDEAKGVGGISKLLSEFTRSNVAKRACVVWINQTRMKVGRTMPGMPQQYVTTGGRALPFYTSIRLDLTMVKKLRVNEESDPYGMKVKVYVAKNKIAPQWRNCELTYLFGKGFSAHFDYFELARKAGAIVKSGSWLSFKEFKAQGDLNFVEAMEKNEDLFNGIKLIVDGENLAQRAVDAQPDEIPESLDLGMEESEALPEAV